MAKMRKKSSPLFQGVNFEGKVVGPFSSNLTIGDLFKAGMKEMRMVDPKEPMPKDPNWYEIKEVPVAQADPYKRRKKNDKEANTQS